jgi:hypothetical protein
VDRIRQRLRLTENEVSLLRYDNPKDFGKCTEVLLLMNVETVLGSRDTGSRFSFHAYADEGWSLEHIHAQNSQGLKKENERRDWLTVHAEKIEATKWPSELQAEADAVTERMSTHLKLPINKTDDLDFESILDRTFALFVASLAAICKPRRRSRHGRGSGVAGGVVREGLAKLFAGPRGCGMPRHVDVHDAAPIAGEDDEDEQDPPGECWDREKSTALGKGH